MSALVATDLDGTLVYSRRSLGPADPADLLAVEERGAGPISWITRGAERLLAELDRAATWVPSTTRTVAEFRRLRLPRTTDGRCRYAVCANGGVLLVDGEPDRCWATRVRRRVADAAGIDEVAARVDRSVGESAGPVRRADDLFLVVPVPDAPAPWSDDLAAWAADRGWVVRAIGRKLYALPAGLTKTAAVEEVLRRAPGGPLLAAGDSLLDADLLLRADAAVRPAHGELHALGWHSDQVAVTAGAGVRAGEEIAAWLLARVRPPGSWASCR